MNILVDRLPRKVQVGGNPYTVRSNFRTFILYELLWQDDTLSPGQKVMQSLELCYPEIPRDPAGAAEALSWFYRCGREDRAAGRQGRAAGKGIRRIYSFEHDADYIYAAFLAQYGTDLQETEYMHWWKFRALFNALTDQNEFVRIMGYRGIDLRDDMPEGQRDFYRRMKELYALPLPRDEEEKQAAIEEALLNGGDLSGIL